MAMFCCFVPDMSQAALESLAAVFRALSSPFRLSLLLRLADGPARVTELSELLDTPQPLVSHHLGILRGGDLVRAERDGRTVLYALADDGLTPDLLGLLLRRYATDRSTHPGESHEHGPDCGHVAIPHQDHIDYLHNGSLHRLGGSPTRWMDCEPGRHAPHRMHRHVHGEGCGHVAIPHGDHVDYIHDGHRHATHDDHYDDH
jgi:DNA-binding transcriptional ArsR family regulator